MTASINAAVAAAAEALLAFDVTVIPDGQTVEAEARELAQVAVAAARPLIEAEVRDLFATTEAALAEATDTVDDLRERIAQAIDNAAVEASERGRSSYRDGYIDGLALAEAITRSTS